MAATLRVETPWTGAHPFVETLGIEAALAHLGHGDGEGAEAGVERLVLEAVGLGLALGTALVGSGADELLPFKQHGRVEQQAHRLGQRLQAPLGEVVEQVGW